MYIYYSLFIYSFVDGHLGSFHLLAIVNSAAEYWYLNICASPKLIYKITVKLPENFKGVTISIKIILFYKR